MERILGTAIPSSMSKHSRATALVQKGKFTYDDTAEGWAAVQKAGKLQVWNTMTNVLANKDFLPERNHFFKFSLRKDLNWFFLSWHLRNLDFIFLFWIQKKIEIEMDTLNVDWLFDWSD